MDEFEMIYRDPEFIEIIIELLGEKDEAPPTEDEACDEVTERVRLRILRRMKQRNAEHQRASTAC